MAGDCRQVMQNELNDDKMELSSQNKTGLTQGVVHLHFRTFPFAVMVYILFTFRQLKLIQVVPEMADHQFPRKRFAENGMYSFRLREVKVTYTKNNP